MVIQIIVTLCSLFVLARAFQKMRANEVRFATYFFWSLLWVLALFFVWKPGITQRLAELLQVTRGADAVFYLSVVLIFYLLFRLFVRQERIDREITTLVKELALLEKKQKDKTTL